MLICAGSEAAKWSAIREAAHFRIVLGKETEISAEQGSQVASSLKQRGKKSDRLFMPFESYCFVKKKDPSYREVFSMKEIRNPQRQLLSG